MKEDKFCDTYSKHGGCNKCRDSYYVSPDRVCLPQEPGCIYEKSRCTYCQHPFDFDTVAQKCKIRGCLEAGKFGCIKCRFPFERTEHGLC